VEEQEHDSVSKRQHNQDLPLRKNSSRHHQGFLQTSGYLESLLLIL